MNEKNIKIEITSSETKQINRTANRFEYLDGYRGYLCLLVIMQHSQGDYYIFYYDKIFQKHLKTN